MTKWSVHMLVLKQSATCTCFFKGTFAKLFFFLFFLRLFSRLHQSFLLEKKKKKTVKCFMMHLEKNTDPNIFILHHDIIRIRICSS